MASGKSSRAGRGTRSTIVVKRSTPWGLIAGISVIVLLVAGFLVYYIPSYNSKHALDAWIPTAGNQDPSTKIPGVTVVKYSGGQHVQPTQQVAYTHSPPFGGTHDGYWAACNGVVYKTAVRSENMVHALEHGSVWIAYNPDKIKGDAVATLAAKITGKNNSIMSPYPGLDQPISLQTWGHQLKLADVNDPRIDEFITALRTNQYQYPEVGASCDALGAGAFDPDNPPAFKAAPPVSAVDNKVVMPEIVQGTQTVPDAGSSSQ